MSRKKLTLGEALLQGKPYFGKSLAAYQGGLHRKAAMIALLNYVADERNGQPVHILEVGSWAGGSVVVWGLGLKHRNTPGRVLCVDSWEPYFDLSVDGDSHYAEMTRAAETGAIYRLFMHNLQAMGVDDIVDHKKGHAQDILPMLESKSFDLVFLDGSHLYDSVRSDIALAKRLLRNGGVLCGDDLELRRDEVDEASHDFALARNVDFTFDPRAGLGYHPGVTEAVSEAFGHVVAQYGVWSVSKCEDAWRMIGFVPDFAVIPPEIIEVQPSIDEELPCVIATIGETNIVRFRDEVFAIPQSLGEVDVTGGAEGIRARYPGTGIEVSTSSQELIARLLERQMREMQSATQSAEQRIRALEQIIEGAAIKRGDVELIATIGETNIVRFRDEVFAIPQSLGEVDVTGGPEGVRARYPGTGIEVSTSSQGLIARLLERQMREMQSAAQSAEQRIRALEQIIEGAATKGSHRRRIRKTSISSPPSREED